MRMARLIPTLLLLSALLECKTVVVVTVEEADGACLPPVCPEGYVPFVGPDGGYCDCHAPPTMAEHCCTPKDGG